MGTVNVGGQKIGWKFSTPLQAEYLNTFISGVTSEGLVTRPICSASPSTDTATISIGKFSMFVKPWDVTDNNTLVKVTTTSDITMTVDATIVAIGFEYSFRKDGTPQSQWFGSFEALDRAKAKNYKGVIVATLLNYKSSSGTRNFFLSSYGADISDCLLLSEGWDPTCWLSLVSPRRMLNEAHGTGHLNQLEVRRHNDSYKGYLNGLGGCVYIDSPRYTIPTDVMLDPNGERGVMLPGTYNLFNLTTDESKFNLCNYGNEFPILHTKRGIFAMVDKSKFNADANTFVNNLNFIPVSKEDLNMWFEQESGTLYIE